MDYEDETQKKDPTVILEKIEKYCIGETNETYERYLFNKREQVANKSVDHYVAALRTDIQRWYTSRLSHPRQNDIWYQR